MANPDELCKVDQEDSRSIELASVQKSELLSRVEERIRKRSISPCGLHGGHRLTRFNQTQRSISRSLSKVCGAIDSASKNSRTFSDAPEKFSHTGEKNLAQNPLNSLIMTSSIRSNTLDGSRCSTEE